ncbi:hypothetical protein DSL72_002157 [Monilinia vaccinii-corymbosi]|uniref:Uncharacterized protein n=1 Tax=Monilinia vaccinii-corymbosi TaxID=61207 RepID=A0A8A3PBV9_9HELO|nr:hypothetical protein DSL72_002157 [Monilinia vaccinii-corymbosi]
MLYRRRKYLGISRSERQSEAGTMTENRRRTIRWLYSTPRDAKAPTVTTDDTEINAVSSEANTNHRRVPAVPFEMPGDNHFYSEMDATSRPSELHNTGLVLLSPKSNVWNNISSSQTPITHSPSAGSNHSQASSVSRASGQSPRHTPISPTRADSLTLNESFGDLQRGRVHSDLSSVAESDRGHLRQLSDASVSVDGDYGNLPPPKIHIDRPSDEHALEHKAEGPGVVSPLTPPQEVGDGGQNYFGPDSVSGGQNVSTTANEAAATAPDTSKKSNLEGKLDE